MGGSSWSSQLQSQVESADKLWRIELAKVPVNLLEMFAMKWMSLVMLTALEIAVVLVHRVESVPGRW